ncbi:hypothetical protein GGH13_003796 [Coemansia sp. S155-1]|nr:hypothetical protein GGH13_003796 [Coemansia sp. S155-1]
MLKQGLLGCRARPLDALSPPGTAPVQTRAARRPLASTKHLQNPPGGLPTSVVPGYNALVLNSPRLAMPERYADTICHLPAPFCCTWSILLLCPAERQPPPRNLSLPAFRAARSALAPASLSVLSVASLSATHVPITPCPSPGSGTLIGASIARACSCVHPKHAIGPMQACWK